MRNPPTRIAREPAIAALVCLFAAALAHSSFADTRPSGTARIRDLCPSYYDEILAKGRALRLSEGGTPLLLPADPSAETFRSAIVAERHGILVETAFLLPRAGPTDETSRRLELARIYGLLRALSSLEGIQYYSATRKKMRTLYAESYRIDGPDTRTRLPDLPSPAPDALPGEETLYAFQRDLSFGSNVYSYVLRSRDGAVSSEVTNLTRMSYGLLPVVGPGGLKTRLLIVAGEDGILFYAASGAASPGLFRGRLADSFSNRAAALFSWFSEHSRDFLLH